jgi:nucleotide-binding universal stress UspA family protein
MDAMSTARQILVAIDDFEGAEPLLQYAAQLSRSRDDMKIHLFHALAPLPPQLLESPGSEDPTAEEQIEAKQEQEQNAWIERARRRAHSLMEQTRSWLMAAEIPSAKIETHLVPLNQRSDLVREIAETARRHHCDTVVVGQTAYPWLHEPFHSHVSEQLKAQFDQFAVCVVRADSS